uniref:Flocculation protein FLO11-like n=1 Tax=Panagrellus redivivus TaxID=6233 RepID=A0A7E4VDD9_PANRE
MGAIGRETRFFVIGSVVLVGVAITGYYVWRRRRFGRPSTRRRRRSVKVVAQPPINAPTPPESADVSTAKSSSSFASLRRPTKSLDKEWEQVSVGPLSDESESIVDCSMADRVRTPLPSSRRREQLSVPNTDSASDNFDFCPVIPRSPTRQEDLSSGQTGASPAQNRPTPTTTPPQKKPSPPATVTPVAPPATASTPLPKPSVLPSPDTLSPSTPQSPLPTTAPPSVGNYSAPSTPASSTSRRKTSEPESSLRAMCDCRISRDIDLELFDDNSLFTTDMKFTPTPTTVYPISFEKHEPPNLTIPVSETEKTALAPSAMKRYHPPGAKESILTAFRPVLNSLVYANKHAFVVHELCDNYQYLE